ncbi:hypothetical protein H6F67_07000 [Microcoleus sp. FACHB-1515]|uniref:hypothetical protein n=1 Tax=Cyanophyceae TaxID=3028117 RepID=UPI001688E081|nr:hypothetical protein [Microcoleus sp. FACHB-1515]MBD2089598.1 hypothetical protein [Microcoleus sp. FACHB-1515]
MAPEMDDQSQSFDAQQMVEEIQEGEQKAPSVDLDADYEAAKAFSVSEIDATEEGAKAAEAATSSHLEVPQPQSEPIEAAETGDPSDYVEMAKDVNPNL